MLSKMYRGWFFTTLVTSDGFKGSVRAMDDEKTLKDFLDSHELVGQNTSNGKQVKVFVRQKPRCGICVNWCEGQCEGEENQRLQQLEAVKRFGKHKGVTFVNYCGEDYVCAFFRRRRRG